MRHTHVLRTPWQAKRARFFLLPNAQKHYGHTYADPFASVAPVMAPRTWLLRRGPL